MVATQSAQSLFGSVLAGCGTGFAFAAEASLPFTCKAVLFGIRGHALHNFTNFRRRYQLALALVLFLFGCLSAWLDATLYPSLFPTCHGATELWTAVLWLLSIRIAVSSVLGTAKRPRLRVALSLVLIGSSIGFVAFRGLTLSRILLRHTAHAFAGRLLARGHRMPMPLVVSVAGRNADLSNPAFGDPSDSACPAGWDPIAAVAPNAAIHAKLQSKPNIVVLFIDTLGADTARDQAIMPNLVRFAHSSLDFSQARSTATDSEYALPSMVRGHFSNVPELYDLSDSDRADEDLALSEPSVEDRMLPIIRTSLSNPNPWCVADTALVLTRSRVALGNSSCCWAVSEVDDDAWS